MENSTVTTRQIQPYANAESFDLAQRMATSLSSSTLVPEIYRGKAGMPNALIALEIAGRVGISPLMCMQNLNIIHGKPSWSSSFLIGMINSCGRFNTLKYQFSGEGDDWTCYAYTTEKSTGSEIKGPPVSIGMAKKEGWYGKNGSKWPNMPELMLTYRAAAFFERTTCPEIGLGMATTEEVYDIGETIPYGETTVADTAKILTEELLGRVVIGEAKEVTDPQPTPDDGLGF